MRVGRVGRRDRVGYHPEGAQQRKLTWSSFPQRSLSQTQDHIPRGRRSHETFVSDTIPETHSVKLHSDIRVSSSKSLRPQQNKILPSIVRAFLIEEQRCVKAVLQEKEKAQKAEEAPAKKKKSAKKAVPVA